MLGMRKSPNECPEKNNSVQSISACMKTVDVASFRPRYCCSELLHNCVLSQLAVCEDWQTGMEIAATC